MNNDVKLNFLGTCAADFSPLLKDKYLNCFDKNARRSSCLLIEDQYLIDCGPHCLQSMAIEGINPDCISDLFLTHTHADHFNEQNIAYISEKKAAPLRIWCHRDCVLSPIPNTKIIRMEFGQEYRADNNLIVFSVDANHDENSFPQHFVFSIFGKKVMYATDGGWVLTRSYNRLKKIGLDVLILDATCGEAVGEYRIAEHNTLPMIRLLLPSLKKVGIIRDDTKIILTHLAPSLHKPHDVIQKSVDDDKITVAYDGLKFYL